jgi:hypothetical protein
MFSGALAAYSALKVAAMAAPAWLRPLLDPRVLIVLGAFLLGAKGCDTWHDYLGLRADRAAIEQRLENEREQRELAEQQAAERAEELARLEEQINAADQALDQTDMGDCACRYGADYIELHDQIGR